MKDMDAMILATARMWSRLGYKPPRNILLVFFADEEAGSTYGSRWLVKHRPELFKGYSEAISEVGGFSINITGDKRIYLVEAAQKEYSGYALQQKELLVMVHLLTKIMLLLNFRMQYLGSVTTSGHNLRLRRVRNSFVKLQI